MSGQILAAVFLIALLTSGGGIFIATRNPSWYRQERMWWLIAVGTGLLFGVAFFEFLPLALSGESRFSPALIILGIFFILIMETYVAPRLTFFEGSDCDHDHAHDHEHKEHPEFEHEHHMISHQAACSAVGCLIICAFFDGFGINSAFAIDAKTGWMTSIGLFFHVLPDGVLAAGIALAGGMSRSRALRVSMLTGGSLIAGAVFSAVLGSFFDTQSVVLPFASGILIYVSLIHLLPVGMRHPNGLLWMISGSGFFFAIHYFFH